ncbi:cation transport protein-domain-containing protein [Fomitopsis serialis]|uniref:cation transport protein-domain-containing protein n=1 Tax=Fomitopsis serialis TaxID=139415 RepID=UPI0020084DD4|nr:cation transport protein-domain-containing protein [Neoantrodia serialis]KAH9922903.1 cation transport protein-domain-containing protein [Neoantrodia serialis]
MPTNLPDFTDWEHTTTRCQTPVLFHRMWSYVNDSLRFYRIHLLLFTIVPLVASVIFWASNGEFKIDFIDALFVCVSAATGTGLSPIDLSSTTPWQQVIVVVLEISGNLVFVSWVVVYIRRTYFIGHLKHIVVAERERAMLRHETAASRASQGSASRAIVGTLVTRLSALQEPRRPPKLNTTHLQPEGNQSRPARATRTLSANMVRRLDDAPRPIDPAGNAYVAAYASSVQPSQALSRTAGSECFPRVRSVESRAQTYNDAHIPQPREAGDFGGFPYPWRILSDAIRRLFPRLHQTLRRTVTMPRTSTLVPPTADTTAVLSGEDARRVEYFSFSTNVGRNSTFHDLTDENIEELGGVEYRALTALLWIVPLYYFGLLAISFIIIAPYANLPQWRWLLRPPEQHRDINPTWFSVFQVVGAWANTGMSLVDQNMVPFRSAYLMIVVLVINVLAGNTAFPLFLRFMIWTFTKLFPADSRIQEALHFLLDHPRRCFIYLFPANQTWVLFTVQFLIDFVVWIFNIVLDIGNPATASIPMGIRVIDALLQAAAVRSSGFQAISVSTLVPAVQVLDVVMMYVAIYPIAMSVRSTNVYEEKSLGIYEADENIEQMADCSESRVEIWGRYLWRHARRQLSFDMWWLALSLFLLCIIERTPLMDTSMAPWFNVFSIIFELVSAYGTVGLSLGVPYANFSFCGALHTLSKLILCAVMVRGRHRGLPVALDRAVLLPHEFERPVANAEEAQISPGTEDHLSEKHGRPNGSPIAHEKDGPPSPQATSIPRTRTLSFAVDTTGDMARSTNVRIDDVAEEDLDIPHIHYIEEASRV